MRISTDRLKDLCRQRDKGLGDLLKEAGVSRTAYYSLVGKDSVLPKSLEAIADVLGVSTTDFLTDSREELRRTQERINMLESILAKHPKANRDNVWHTLLLLEEEPVERMKRGLLRGRIIHIHE